jgi:fructosamine-3-kinase
MRVLEQIKRQLERQLKISLQSGRFTKIEGGDVNTAYQLKTATQSWFIKLNKAELLFMFEAEKAGLKALADLNCVRIPTVIACGTTDDYAYLILEYLPLRSLSVLSERLFAEQLARQHLQPQSYFGWFQTNTIGSTRQENGYYTDWGLFWQQQRLGKQLSLAAEKGYIGKLQRNGEKLNVQLTDLFSNYFVQPALLHGDLWRGNVAADNENQPVMFDPACYYGDREADIAMTELFAGFSADFYAVYQAHYPLDPGYSVRKTLYNLYHILNHLNLFGSGYLRQAEIMIEKLLAQL